MQTHAMEQNNLNATALNMLGAQGSSNAAAAAANLVPSSIMPAALEVVSATTATTTQQQQQSVPQKMQHTQQNPLQQSSSNLPFYRQSHLTPPFYRKSHLDPPFYRKSRLNPPTHEQQQLAATRDSLPQQQLQQQQSSHQISRQQRRQQLPTQTMLSGPLSMSMDSTAQTAQAQTAQAIIDMQEEVYQKIRSMKEMYSPTLSRMYQNLASKLEEASKRQQEGCMLLPNQSEQLERLKKYMAKIGHVMRLLTLHKSNIPAGLKEKLAGYENQIISMVSSVPWRKTISNARGQQFQHPSAINQPMQQHSLPVTQLSQLCTLPNLTQPMSVPLSVSSVQSPAVSNVQIGSMPSTTLISACSAPENIATYQGSASSSLQQSAVSFTQHGSLGAMHEASINGQQENSIIPLMKNSMHSTVNPLQQQLMQSQRIRQHHLQQQIIQQRQEQHILQQRPQPQQCSLQQNQLPHQASQVQPHQMQRPHQMNKKNAQLVMKSGITQSHSQAAQRQTCYQQLKPSSSFSPETSSQLVPQHSSLEVVPQALPSNHMDGTPVESVPPPFVVPSPCTPSTTSPLPGDREQQPPGVSSLTDTENVVQQRPIHGQAQRQTLAIGTSGIPASSLLPELPPLPRGRKKRPRSPTDMGNVDPCKRPVHGHAQGKNVAAGMPGMSSSSLLPELPPPLPGDHEKQPPGILYPTDMGNVAARMPVHGQAQGKNVAARMPEISNSPLLPELPALLPSDHEKQPPGISSLTNAGSSDPQKSVHGQFQGKIDVGMPGISASPLFEELPPPMPGGDHEKQPPGVSSLTNVGNVHPQKLVHGQARGKNIDSGVSGTSTSPGSGVGLPPNVPTDVPGNSSCAQRPIDRLLKAIKSASPAALNSAARGICSVVRMVDGRAGSTVEIDSFGSTASVKESCKRSSTLDTPELEATTAPNSKRLKVEGSHSLRDEIRDINRQLIETVVDVTDDVVAEGEGTVVKFSYCPVALSSDVSPFLPLHILIPVKYPKSPPIVLDKMPEEISEESTDLSAQARSRFSISLKSLPQNMCLKDMARAWDFSAHDVFLQYAKKNGGGSFSSTYGSWTTVYP